jgi:hypothetical protein
VRFTRQFLTANAEGRIRRGIFNARQLRQRGNGGVDNVVQLRPVNLTVVTVLCSECSQRQLSSITVFAS